MLAVTSQNFSELMEKSAKQPVLIDFWAPWCGPCRMLGPVLEQVSAETEGKAVIGKVNVDEESELAQQFGVSSIPTLVVIKDKQIINKAVGYQSADKLKKLLGV